MSSNTDDTKDQKWSGATQLFLTRINYTKVHGEGSKHSRISIANHPKGKKLIILGFTRILEKYPFFMFLVTHALYTFFNRQKYTLMHDSLLCY